MLEKELERKCKLLASKSGCLLLKFVSPGTSGVPDRILVAPGGVVFIEFKQTGKKATALQAAVMRKITAAGGTCYVCDNVETFREILAGVSTTNDFVPV